MYKYKYAVSLRIEHPSIAKEEIVKNLGVSPEFSYSAGETRKTPSGKPLEGLYKITYCCFDIIPTKKGDFTDEIEKLIKQFSGLTSFFEKLTAEGGKVEFFVGIFADETIGFTLKSKDIVALASMSLELSVEVYAQ